MPIQLIYDNVSIKDFDEKINKFESLNDKFDFITKYVLSYGINDNTQSNEALENESNVKDVNENKKFPLGDFVHHVKESFIEASLNTKKEYEKKTNNKLPKEIVNPNEDSKSILQSNQQKFVQDPFKYLYGISKEMPSLIDEEKEDSEKIEEWKRNCARLTGVFKTTYRFYDLKEKSRNIDDIKRFACKESHINQNLSANKAIGKNKGNIFERIFRRTSREYRDFERAFKDYNDKNSYDYGEKDALIGATKAYIHHKIPSFDIDGDKLPTPEEIARFSGTSKNRLNFCVGVLKGLQQQKEKTQMIEAIRTNEFSKKQNVVQESFQKDLNKDMEEFEVISHNKNDIDKINAKNIYTNDYADVTNVKEAPQEANENKM